MRLLRTIFTQHKHHLSNRKYSSSSPIPLRSLQSSNIDHPSEAVEEPQTQTNESDNTTNHHQPSSSSSSSGWSMYRHVFDTPVTHHSDHNEVEEQEEEEGEKASVGILKMSERVGRSTIGTKKKEKTHWVCCNCGYTIGKWWGTCPSCDITGTMKEFHEAKSTNDDNKLKTGLAVSEDAVGLWLPHKAAQLRPVKLEEVNSGFDQDQWRIPLSGSFGSEVSTVLGGGLVPGSLTLISGDPGVGKSTLLLQIAALIAEGPNDGEASPVLYVSGEESLQQIGNRANRLGIKSDIHLYSSTDIEDILKKAQGLSFRALIVDSIQTVYLKGIVGSAGGIMQVKECTTALMRFAKTTNIPVLLIGHVTKSGDIAGPRVLEHIVDVVLYMECCILLNHKKYFEREWEEDLMVTSCRPDVY